MGFSITGIILTALIFLPNVLMLLFPPKEMPVMIKNAGVFFTVLERLGQIVCIMLLCLSGNLGFCPVTVWLVLTLACIAAYWGLWLRYVLKGRTFYLLFCPLGFIPIPMAIFPVLAFTFAAAAGVSLWLGIAVILLAIGHIKISWHIYRQIT